MSESTSAPLQPETGGKSCLYLNNKQDREAVAMALFRAGYTVREAKRKENGKLTVILEYWR